MTNREELTTEEAGRQAEHRRQIELIFAQACAESLKELAFKILEPGEIEQRKVRAKDCAETYASAFTFVLDHFTSLSREKERQPGQADPSSSA